MTDNPVVDFLKRIGVDVTKVSKSTVSSLERALKGKDVRKISDYVRKMLDRLDRERIKKAKEWIGRRIERIEEAIEKKYPELEEPLGEALEEHYGVSIPEPEEERLERLVERTPEAEFIITPYLVRVVKIDGKVIHIPELTLEELRLLAKKISEIVG